ncbi:MAG: hypothetical protein Q8O00_08630, partial [Holophaga sp.]|nr:hypothetical protein [Holophaga sp.]
RRSQCGGQAMSTHKERIAAAAKSMRVSPRLIESAQFVSRNAPPEISQAIVSGDLTMNIAVGIAKLPVKAQGQVLALVHDPKAMKETAKRLIAEHKPLPKRLSVSRDALLVLICATFPWTRCFVSSDGEGEPPESRMAPLVALERQLCNEEPYQVEHFIEALEDCVKAHQEVEP